MSSQFPPVDSAQCKPLFALITTIIALIYLILGWRKDRQKGLWICTACNTVPQSITNARRHSQSKAHLTTIQEREISLSGSAFMDDDTSQDTSTNHAVCDDAFEDNFEDNFADEFYDARLMADTNETDTLDGSTAPLAFLFLSDEDLSDDDASNLIESEDDGISGDFILKTVESEGSVFLSDPCNRNRLTASGVRWKRRRG